MPLAPARAETGAVLLFPAELTHDPAAGFVRAMRAELQRSSADVNADVVADFTADVTADVLADVSALQQFDSSAIAVLLECRRLALQAGRRFSVTGAPIKLQQLAQLYGVDDLFPATPRA